MGAGLIAGLVAVGLAGCGSEQGAPSRATPPSDAAAAGTIALVPFDAAPAPPAPVPIDATPGPPADAAPPIATWPFTAWDRAEAITFNDLPYGPGIPLRVYDAEHGWNPNLVERKPVERAAAERAAGWVIETRGEIEVSKCPFPRHAVVFYAGDTPVGTANLCFECGDLLVWPAFEPAPDLRTRAGVRTWEKLYARKAAAYERLYPRWETFFRDELGL